ncbi:hypothetical protein Scani_12220 [Streptomyces caniferus]|uniref:Uncharacterized protein n=2 Tax=Streptomyces caniferus TaxID=285557 RepID=A0A640S210_9ACTN|nr:hypothetical protein Scani_12220 [Streptomyces caniferus]
MATSSTQVVCNHRALEVMTLFFGSTVVGLLAGIILVALGMAPLAATGAGAATLGGAFGLGMTAVSYIKKQDV